MVMSKKRLDQAMNAIQQSRRKYKFDIQTWLSAAVTFNQACKDALESHAPPRNSSLAQLYDKVDYISRLISNSLALVIRIPDPAKRTGEWATAGAGKLLQSKDIEADAVVSKDGTGDYGSISEAIGAATGERFVIYVKSGVYAENVIVHRDGIVLIGDGKNSTVITGNRNVAAGASLSGSATLSVTGDGFMARDIGISNTAGPSAAQAVALNIVSDHAVLYRCSITGYQDTLYAVALRQFYRECDISGTIDFIFGNAAAVFQVCNLILRRPNYGASNVILANGRTDPGQNTGFALQMCTISVGPDLYPDKGSYRSYLGRPWKAFSRAVVMESTIDAAVSPSGWLEWPDASAGTYSTLYFAEYANYGTGSGTSGRVKWPGFHVIRAAEAETFTVENFIDGESWLPPTGVAYYSGL
ncbi:pectinesterase [Genlisea aurea]|uniref:Pectinesterase n=1 Tax=Genlisea aurea TaxID=192259 RepID=S8C7Z6_9LAMI|nr:pectinesterase [Genlisea aurea]